MSGIQIGNKHTEKDWNLIWQDVDIGAPDIQSNFVSVPYRNGLLDLTESEHTGVRYANRTLSFSFFYRCDMRRWKDLYSEILNHCHGKTHRIVLDSDPFYYYEGRINVSSKKEDALHASLTIKVDAQPFRKPLASTIEDWLWDPFCFDTDIIRDYGYINVQDSAHVTIIAGEESEIPIFHCSSSILLEYNGKQYQLKKGINKCYDFIIQYHQSYDLTFIGNGIVSIEFLAGEL